MSLPHPKRMLACEIYPHLEKKLSGLATIALHEMLKDTTLTKGMVIQHLVQTFPHAGAAFAELIGSNARLSLAQLEPIITPLRFTCLQGRIYEVRPELDRLLAHTDIGAQAPARYFRLPYPSMYMMFGAGGDGLEVVNELSGDTYTLEGAYLVELELGPDYPERTLFPDLRDNDPIRVCEITLVGAPKRNPLDCGFVFARLMLPTQWGDRQLQEILDQQLSAFKREGRSELQARGAAALRAGVLHVAKTLLYLNSEQVRIAQVFDEKALRERLARVKGGKRGKLERQLERVYDRIMVGPETDSLQPLTRALGPHVRSHWRRGHFRNQPFGEDRMQRKLIWIQPTLVGAHELASSNDAAATAPSKDFVIK